MSQSVVRVALTSLTIASLAFFAFAWRAREVRARQNAGVSPAVATVEDWREVAFDSRALSTPTPQDGAVTVTVFSDFDCGYCEQFARTLRMLEVQYGDSVRIGFRNFPLVKSHPRALDAAVAAYCAGEQGAFVVYHDALFARSGAGERSSFSDLARSAGVRDAGEFEECRVRPSTKQAIDNDLRLAKRIGVRITPTVLVDHLLVPGNIQFDSLVNLVKHMRSQR